MGLILFANFSRSNAQDLGWINNGDLRFSLLKDNLTVNDLPSTSSDFNRDCIKRDLILKFSQIPFLGSTEKINLCSVDTSTGVLADKYMQLDGSNKAGLVDLGGNNLWVFAGDNSRSFIITDRSAPTGLYVNYLPQMSLSTKTNLDSSISHTLTNPADTVSLKNAFNQKLTMMPDTLSFSSNGKWALFDSSGYGYVRMNLDDGTILGFGKPTTYNMGFDPSYKTAISSDGRYAIFATVGSSVVYDLNDCPTNQTSLSYLKDCKSREINSERLAKTSNFGRAMTIVRFTSDNSFTYYTGQREGDTVVYKQYRVTLGDVPLYGMQYLGMGDSFASGEGSYNYKPFTDTSENNCHTSLSSYPFLLGSRLNKETYNTIACSGAITNDVFSDNSLLDEYFGQFKDGKNQSERTSPEVTGMLSSFTPGKITQQTFVNKLTPEAITVSVGGNDIGFADKIKSCLYKDLDGTCFNSYEDRAEVLIEINNAIPKIEDTFRSLKINNNRVYALGYPSIVASNGNCANNVKFNNSEVDFSNKLVTLLNNAVSTAAKRAGVYYVDTTNILEGHRLCEVDSSQAYVHGLTTDAYQRGDKWNWGIAQESFHPKEQAEALYADAILSQTSNLTKPMPKPDPAASFLALPPSDSYWQVVKTNRSIFMPIYFNDLLGAQEYQNDQISKQLSQSQTNLQPDSPVILEMHSNPVSLGTFRTDLSGNLLLNFTIPVSIDPGYHSLHIYGKNTSGQDVDIYDYIFIGASPDDLNGNEVVDTNEGCLFIVPLGIDSDKDGIDDTCDGFADPLPPVPVIPDLPNNQGGSDNQSGSDNNTNNTTGSGLQDTSSPQGSENPTVPLIVEPPVINPPVIVSPLPVEVINNGEVTDLPTIEVSPNVKNTDPSTETNAGNEPVVPVDNSSQSNSGTTQQATNPQSQSTRSGSNTGINQSVINTTDQPVIAPNVLSETDQNKSTNPIAEPVVASANNVAKTYKFYQRAWLYYVLLGLVSLSLIIGFLLYRRRQASSN